MIEMPAPVMGQPVRAFKTFHYLSTMKKKYLFPFIVVLLVLLLVVCTYNTLPEQVPSHFDSDGNASSTMSRKLLYGFPVLAALFAALPYILSIPLKKLRERQRILASTFWSLIILCSLCLTLTNGKMSFFMYLEPILLVAGIICLLIKQPSKQ